VELAARLFSRFSLLTVCSLRLSPDQAGGRLRVQRLKRAFNIDIETCSECGGEVKIIACPWILGNRVFE